MCEPEDNIYGIEFIRFKIRDLDTKETSFEIAKPLDKYFVFSFLRLLNVGVTVKFKIEENLSRVFCN